MSFAFGAAIYLMIWFTTLFAVLPFGVRTQGEDGDVVEGTPESAPVAPRLLRTALINTVVASIAFAFVYYALENDLMGLRASMVAPNPPRSVTP